MDKYKDDDTQERRTKRNENLYNKIDESDFENLNLTSNISIIKTDTENLNIDEIKEILNEKYQSRSKVREIEEPDSEYADIDEEDTKEYDLKKALDEAHKNKTSDYDKERFKKLRETQYEILNSLNFDKKNEEESEETLTVEEANLMNLIKTVNENALRNSLSKEEDLLEELKGDDDTEILEPANFDDTVTDKKPTIVEELEKTKQLSRKEIDSELERLSADSDIKKISLSDEEEDEEDDTSDDFSLSRTEELSNSFYTGNLQIDKKDMEEFLDLEDEMKGGSIVIKVLVIFIVLIVIAVAVYLLNKYLNLGLF